MKILLILAETLEQKFSFSRSALFYMKARISLKYFVNDGSSQNYVSSVCSSLKTNMSVAHG